MATRIEQLVSSNGLQMVLRHNGTNGWHAALENANGKQVPFRDTPSDVGIILSGIGDKPNDSLSKLCEILRGKYLVVEDPTKRGTTKEIPVPYDLS